MTLGQSNKGAPSSSPTEPQRPPTAWQPFTPRGLAAFAKATFGRTFLLLFLVALIGSGTIVWFLNAAWFPAIRAAIRELPEQGEISHREMKISRAASKPLAEHHFLGFVILVDGTTDSDLSSHIGIKFRKRTVDICSLFGCLRLDYPPDWTIQFNRVELQPRW